MADPTTKIQRFLPSHYKEVVGKFLPALYSAVNSNIAETERLIQACIDQLFSSTASGKYLIQLSESEGFIMPPASGLDIQSYKALVPVMTQAPKQVRISIEDLVQSFYGVSKTRPEMVSSVVGPYSISNGDNLIVESENGTVDVAIVEGQVSDFTNVSAEEIAAVLNLSQSIYYASFEYDRATGQSKLKLSSNTRGGGSYLKVIGGTLQNVLKMPNLSETKLLAGMTWNLSKESTYTDVLRFTWDGIGDNPDLYKVSPGDYVTIKGLTPESINGSFDVIDIGYDYFVVRNEYFDFLTGSITQPFENSIVFTQNKKTTVFDKDEYALVSETKGQTVTITVPAAPPLVRRTLKGSAHLHGNFNTVIDFTRNSIKFKLEENDDIPNPDNVFLLSSTHQRFDFRKKMYKTISGDNNPTEPTYLLDASGSDEYSVLPYTIPTTIGNNPILAEIGSSDYKLTFNNYKHGLEYGWGFSLDGFSGSSNILASDINQEHIVKSLIDSNGLVFEIKDTSGSPIVFAGISFGISDVYRHSSSQADGSDFYMDFGAIPSRVASGLSVGLTFQLDQIGGTNLNVYYGGLLRSRTLTVVSVDGSKVNISAGLGVGPEGMIIDDVAGSRSGYIGGNSGTYNLDKSSAHNIYYVLDNLKLVFCNSTMSDNDLYVGPYLYDPIGAETSVTVSQHIVLTKEKILKGQTVPNIVVSSPTTEYPNKGLVIFDYGRDSEEGPVALREVVTNQTTTQLMLDPAYKFKKTHNIGSQVQFVWNKYSYSPKTDGSDFPPYITGTTSARNVMFALADLLVSAGIFIETDIQIPELRYSDPAIDPFE